MAHRAQEVAVGRAGEQVEIIATTLQRPGQNQGLAEPGSSHTPRGKPQDGEVGHESPKWSDGSAPTLRGQL